MSERIRKRYVRWILLSLVLIPATIVLLVVVSVFAFFNARILYSGDGVYPSSSSHGATFQVLFPEIDTTQPSTYTYRFRRLGPPIGWVVGLRTNEWAGHRAFSDAAIRLTLTNEHGARVFDETIDLREVGPSSGLVSKNGVVQETPIDDRGSVRIEPIGKGVDGGWGTHFEPRWRGRYMLRATVIRPSTQPSYPIRVVMEAYFAGP
jgi:hypothetical protein